MRAGGAVAEFVEAVKPLQKYPSFRELGITTGTAENYRAWQDAVDFQYRPVLALFGDHDVLVNWRESERIFRQTFEEGGNREVTIKVFKNADHNLMTGSSPHLNVAYASCFETALSFCAYSAAP